MRQRKGIGGSVSGLVGVDDPQGGSRELDLSQMENYGFWSTKKWLTYQFSRTTLIIGQGCPLSPVKPEELAGHWSLLWRRRAIGGWVLREPRAEGPGGAKSASSCLSVDLW